MASQKSSPSWASQIASWMGLGLFSPFGMRGFSQLKPEMAKNMFGDYPGMTSGTGPGFGGTHGTGGDIGRYRRFTQDFDPWSFLSQGGGYERPGGPSSEERGILDRSLFGRTAGLSSVKAPPELLAEFNRQLGQRGTELGSRFASEGSYMSGPMMNANAQMTGDAMSQFAAQMALANQGTEQKALDSLYQDFFGPGQRMLQMLAPYFNLPNTSSSSSSFMDYLMQGLKSAGQIAAAS